jgi:hypothetical protein
MLVRAHVKQRHCHAVGKWLPFVCWLDTKVLSGSFGIAEAQKFLTIPETVESITVGVVDTAFSVALYQLFESILQSGLAAVYSFGNHVVEFITHVDTSWVRIHHATGVTTEIGYVHKEIFVNFCTDGCIQLNHFIFSPLCFANKKADPPEDESA